MPVFSVCMFFGKFQFLIGTVKTSLEWSWCFLLREFQFLIGTVKTTYIPAFGISYQKFQFLIGTVKTGNGGEISFRRTPVSIPHRYCKNLLRLANPPYDILKFQFLIGTVKTYLYCKPLENTISFQFLIGTVKTYQKYWHTVQNRVVSIPHRYCKN